ALSRPDASAPASRGLVHRAQCCEQGSGDARLPRCHSEQPVALHNDRAAGSRRDVGVIQATIADSEMTSRRVVDCKLSIACVPSTLSAFPWTSAVDAEALIWARPHSESPESASDWCSSAIRLSTAAIYRHRFLKPRTRA